jgi:uncharacterized protein (TIGR02271 family)
MGREIYSTTKFKLMSDEDNELTNLVELGGSKYEIVDGESNVKGWNVKDEHGADLGEVDELLFDPETLSVRYLVVDLYRSISGGGDKRVLVPIGIADLKADAEVVVLPNVSSGQLSRLPNYEKGALTLQTEREIRLIFEGGEPDADKDERLERQTFYGHQHFDEDKFYNAGKLPVVEEHLEIGKKQVETGRTSVSSRIVARNVEGSVDLKKEQVSIERTPVNRPLTAADGDVFKEQHFEIIEHAEVPVVTKEARVVEEITIRKDVEAHQETIHETLRSTEVKAEHLDPGQKGSTEHL